MPQAVVLDELQPEVAGAFQRSLQCLSQAGARIEFIPATAFAELAAINADGGFTALESWRWHQALIAERADGYDPRVLSRIRRGASLATPICSCCSDNAPTGSGELRRSCRGLTLC